MASRPDDAERADRRIGVLRLIIGAAQGLIAWRLLALAPPTAFPLPAATAWAYRHPTLFAMIVLVTAVIPVVALVELGRMRVRALALYLGLTAAVLAALAAYDIWSDPVDLLFADRVRFWPSSFLLCCATMGMFIVNQLVEHRQHGHRLYAGYATHFDDSWMRAFQLILSLLFTLLVWGVLELGGALFALIKLEWFREMIRHNGFRCPALAMAFAVSIHITDVRPALLQGARNLGLTLLSWLLPLVVLVGCGFLAALVFTGPAPLWATRSAASILMSATAVTLILLNAAYRDGDAANLPAAAIRWAGRVAGPMMLAFTLLASYALALRVGQYGLTEKRVLLGAVVIVALVYGVGYSWASLDRRSWLTRIERVNITASIGILVALALLLTPIARPERLAVNNQLSRLAAGTVSADRFDYHYLRFRAGRYGAAALAGLAEGTKTDVAARAKLAQKAKEPVYAWQAGPSPAMTEPALSHATVYPRGASLPADFRVAAKTDLFGTSCLHDGSLCDIIILDQQRGDATMLLVIDRQQDIRRVIEAAAPVFGRAGSGEWRRIGTIGNLRCPGVLDALRRGEVARMRPLYDDFQSGGRRLPFMPDPSEPEDCVAPVQPSKAPPPADASAPAGMGPAFGKPAGL